MKLLATALVALLGGYSLAAAQSSGSGISILPPATKSTSNSNPSNPATTGANTGKDDSNPANARDDNRISKTTDNPAIQKGPVK